MDRKLEKRKRNVGLRALNILYLFITQIVAFSALPAAYRFVHRISGSREGESAALIRQSTQCTWSKCGIKHERVS